ncbi:MAG: S49 family peptidase [Planctomycetes bacterium]|nr:S49 family peptidase [Planctomycetota bacterium]
MGGKLITTGLWDKLGVSWVEYKRGRNADLLNTSRPFNDRQRARMEGLMYEIYRVFQDQVVEGRREKLKKHIDDLSGGRIYTGIQAKELGLVDEIGGLNEAIAFAANKVSLKDYQLRILPPPKNLFTEVMEELLGQSDGERPWDISSKGRFPLRSNLSGSSSWLAILETLGKLDQTRVRLFVQGLQRILLIQQERVITMMPMDFTIR